MSAVTVTVPSLCGVGSGSAPVSHPFNTAYHHGHYLPTGRTVHHPPQPSPPSPPTPPAAPRASFTIDDILGRKDKCDVTSPDVKHVTHSADPERSRDVHSHHVQSRDRPHERTPHRPHDLLHHRRVSCDSHSPEGLRTRNDSVYSDRDKFYSRDVERPGSWSPPRPRNNDPSPHSTHHVSPNQTSLGSPSTRPPRPAPDSPSPNKTTPPRPTPLHPAAIHPGVLTSPALYKPQPMYDPILNSPYLNSHHLNAYPGALSTAAAAAASIYSLGPYARPEVTFFDRTHGFKGKKLERS